MRKPHSPETREKMRISALNRNPEAEARRVAASRLAKQSPEGRAVASAAARKRYQNPEERRLASERRCAFLANPENLATHRAATSKSIAKASAANVTHGMTGTPEHEAWISMNQRCSNPKIAGWKDYGGRGISVFAGWTGPDGFMAFFGHIGPKPSLKHTLGRLNNDGNYEPGNVAWQTWDEQMANTSRSRLLTIGGVTKHAAAWARFVGISTPTLMQRVKAGWPEDRWLEPSSGRGRPRSAP